MARRIEDEFGHVQQLILIGKERGYVLYDEINDSLPADVHSSQEIDDLLSTLEGQGIEIYEDLASANATRAAATPRGPADPKEELTPKLALTSASVWTPNPRIRSIYLRDIRPVPLLTAKAKQSSPSASSAGSSWS